MTDQAKIVVVWDVPVRIFHWSLVLFFAIAYLSGDESEQWHAYSGYVVTGLLVFRVIWGFIGTKYARFSSFVFSPQVIKQYLGSMLDEHPKRYLGHNPAGGAMVVTLLLTLTLCCWTGLVAYGKEGKGTLAQTSFTPIQLLLPTAKSMTIMASARIAGKKVNSGRISINSLLICHCCWLRYTFLAWHYPVCCIMKIWSVR